MEEKNEGIELKNLLIKSYEDWKSEKSGRSYGVLERDTGISKSTISRLLNSKDSSTPGFEQALILFSYMKKHKEFKNYYMKSGSNFAYQLRQFFKNVENAEFIPAVDDVAVGDFSKAVLEKFSDFKKEYLKTQWYKTGLMGAVVGAYISYLIFSIHTASIFSELSNALEREEVIKTLTCKKSKSNKR